MARSNHHPDRHQLHGFASNCDLDPFAEDVFKQAEKFDTRDYNILGALQFVAKALEVWFMIIAACLVYDLTMFLASRGDGLPIGYLMTHVEFSDILTLGDRAFWASAQPLQRGEGRRRLAIIRLYVFVGFVAFLCVLSNFMGPATAVLVLPTLGWSEIELANGGEFKGLTTADTPRVRADTEVHFGVQRARRILLF